MIVPPYSVGVVIALLVVAVCVVGLVLILAGVAFEVAPLVAVLILGIALGLARLT